MNIQEQLDKLAEFMAQRDLIDAHKKDAISQVVTPEIQKQLDDIDAEFNVQAAAVDCNIEELTNDIKAAVLAEGASIKGAHLHAVWAKGRVSWDSKKLDGLMIAIPALKDARKEGEPSVSIRRIG